MQKKRGMTFIVAFGAEIPETLNSTGGGIMANKPNPWGAPPEIRV